MRAATMSRPRYVVGQPVDRARHPLAQVDEALAARRPLMRRRVPEQMEVAAADFSQLVIGEALPLAEILLGEVGIDERLGAGDFFGPGSRRGRCSARLVRAQQVEAYQTALGSSLPGEAGEHASLQSQSLSIWP